MERLKELKVWEEREAEKKIQRYQGKMVITEQIKDRERQRVRAKELLELERLEMVKKTQELVEEEKVALEVKRIENDRMSKVVAEFNRKNEGNKERKKREERELDVRMLQYQIDKGKKEEEELAEKRRLQDEKEKETQKLREKQEKAKDQQSVMDAIRAKRAFEESERNAREKEKREILIRVS